MKIKNLCRLLDKDVFIFPTFALMFFRPIAILLLVSLLVANCASLFVYMGFEANKQFIASELCVNKDKPEMHCKGKCYLQKKLKQAQDKEQKQERQAQKTQVQDALVVSALKFKRYAFAKVTLHIPISTGMPQSIKNSIFHPPQEV
jgi:hypothetical protein